MSRDPKHDMLFELLSVPHSAHTAEHVDGAFMGGVFVGFGASTRRDGEELHVDGLGAYGFGGDGWGVHETLLALIGFSGTDEPASGGDGFGLRGGRHTYKVAIGRGRCRAFC